MNTSFIRAERYALRLARSIAMTALEANMRQADIEADDDSDEQETDFKVFQNIHHALVLHRTAYPTLEFDSMAEA